MTLYLTSDLHLGHRKVAEIRGFSTAREHDEAVMGSLYGALGPTDSLWILGDLTSGARAAEVRALALLHQLAESVGTHLHLIEGNHDSCSSVHRDGWKRQPEFLEVFDSVHAMARRRGPDRKPVFLSHYPYAWHGDGPGRGPGRYDQYRLPDLGEWLVHGHTHETSRLSGERQIHVGWDAWRRPVAWNEIEGIIRNSQEETA